MRYLLILFPLLVFATSPKDDSFSVMEKILTANDQYLETLEKNHNAKKIKKLNSYDLLKGKKQSFNLLKKQRFVDNRIQEYTYLLNYDHGYHLVTFRYVKVTMTKMKLTEIYVSNFTKGKYEKVN